MPRSGCERHPSPFAEVGIARPLPWTVRSHERLVHPFACALERGSPADQAPAELGAVAHLAVDADDRDGAVFATRAVDQPPAPRFGFGGGEDRMPGGGQFCSFQSVPADAVPSYVGAATTALTGKSQRGGV